MKRAQRAAVAASANPDLLDNEENKEETFESVGLCAELAAACRAAGWTHPTRIQAATIPVAVTGKDIVGIAQTGSGKTGAYCLPCVQWLLSQPKVPYVCVLVMVPTRELAVQVTQQFEMLGRSVGLRVVTLVGGVDMVTQACELSKRPHVLVGTPGRVKDHLTNTKGFSLVKLQWLILDEADKMLDMDYEREINAILAELPRSRQTLLFSATLSTKLDRLQAASLRDPVVLQVHRKNTTVETLQQLYIFCPFSQMMAHLHLYLTKESGNHILIFCSSAALVHRITISLRVLGHHALPLMGRMTQENRQFALQKFKDGKVRMLVCTDLAQRGLDIAHTDVVINFSLPLAVKDYIHRVGRTARAGAHGKAVNLISQYDILQLQNIEATVGAKFTEFPISEVEVNSVLQRVENAEQEAFREMKEHEADEKMEKEQRQTAGPKPMKRVRSEAIGTNDAMHGTRDFAVRRMRKEHEEVFGMTKKQAHKNLHQLRRENKRDSKRASSGGGGGH